MVWKALIQAMAITLLNTAPESAWTSAAQTDGISVFTREKPGSSIREVKATAQFDAPPQDVWKVIRNYPDYKNTMPYTQESLVLRQNEEGKVTYFYSVVEAPFVDKRDFVLKILDESDWQEGKGYLKASWTTTEDIQVKNRRRMVRLTQNDGYWLLEPRNEGKATAATYYLYTDPGGAIPNFIINKANTSAIPDIFRAIRKKLGSSGKG